MYKKNVALNNLQWLMCLKAKPNQFAHNWFQTTNNNNDNNNH